MNDPSWMNFTNHIQENLSSRPRTNILVSDENILSLPGLQTNLRHLHDAFDGYDVRVIVTYRRYYDWISSIYNQNSKLNAVNTNSSATGTTSRPQQQQQKYIVPFPKFYQKHFLPHPPSSVLTKSTVDTIQSVFPNISIFNMYNNDGSGSGGLLERFVCHELYDVAQDLCDSILSSSKRFDDKDLQHYHDLQIELNTIHNVRVNSMELDSMYIAQQALLTFQPTAHTTTNAVEDDMSSASLVIKRKLKNDKPFLTQDQIIQGTLMLHKDVESFIRKQLEQNEEATNSDILPWECLESEQYIDILTTSLELEKYLVPDYHNTPGIQESLHRDFQDAIEGHTFCSVNVNELLKKDDWKAYIKHLVDEYIRYLI